MIGYPLILIGYPLILRIHIYSNTLLICSFDWESFTLVTQYVVKVPKSLKITLEKVGQVLYRQENNLIKLLSSVVFIFFTRKSESFNSLHCMLLCYLLMFSKCKSGMQSVWIQIWLDNFVGPNLGPSCLQVLIADNTSRQRIKSAHFLPIRKH